MACMLQITFSDDDDQFDGYNELSNKRRSVVHKSTVTTSLGMWCLTQNWQVKKTPFYHGIMHFILCDTYC